MQSLHTSLTKKNSNKYLPSIYSWISLGRYWVPRERSWYLIYSLLFVLLMAVLAILQEYLLILVVLAFAFMWFVQATIPPNEVEHTINMFGIKTFGKLYKWRDISEFWFSERSGVTMLNIDLHSKLKPDSTFKKRISLLLNPKEDENIFFLLIKQLIYGDVNEIGYNILTEIVYGKYIEITKYIPEQDDEDYRVLNSISTTETRESKLEISAVEPYEIEMDEK